MHQNARQGSRCLASGSRAQKTATEPYKGIAGGRHDHLHLYKHDVGQGQEGLKPAVKTTLYAMDPSTSHTLLLREGELRLLESQNVPKKHAFSVALHFDVQRAVLDSHDESLAATAGSVAQHYASARDESNTGVHQHRIGAVSVGAGNPYGVLCQESFDSHASTPKNKNKKKENCSEQKNFPPFHPNIHI